jgi:hypothetical protein
MAMVAVERYRLAHHGWPESLRVTIPDFLKRVPIDPYDGRPLRYRRLAHGVVIYSLGPDRQDNGGNLDRDQNLRLYTRTEAPGTDTGFQLWDPRHRRQLPAPAGPVPGDSSSPPK